MPSRSSTRSAGLVEACRAGDPRSPPRHSCMVTLAFSAVVPVPRFLGRSHVGDRGCRNRRPRQRRARGRPRGRAGRRVVGCAGLRGCCGRRAPAPYRAKQTASSTLVLPAPGGPVEEEQPGVGQRVEVDLAVPANGPKAVTVQAVQPHQSGRLGGTGVRIVETRRAQQQRALGLGGRRAAHGVDEVEGDLERRTAAADALGPPPASAAGALRGRRPARACGGTGARRRSMAPGRPAASVSVTWQPGSSCAGQAGVGQQVVERRRAGRQPARHRRLDELRAAASRPEVDEPHALRVAGLGEGVGERGPAVAHACRRSAAARAGGRGRRSRCRRTRAVGTLATPPTEMSRSLLAGHSAGDERVRQHHRPAGRGPRGRRVRGASPRSARRSWPRSVRLPAAAYDLGFEVGDAVDRGAVAVEASAARRARGRCAGGRRRSPSGASRNRGAAPSRGCR